MSNCNKFNVKILKIYKGGTIAKAKIDIGFKLQKTVKLPAVPGHLFNKFTRSIELIEISSYNNEWVSAIPSNSPIECWEYKCKIIKVYDGDTCTGEISMPFNFQFETTFRLAGIDTPELRGDEREDGLISRDVLRDKVLNKNVTVITEKDKAGKYGRYLGTFRYRNQNINKFLLENGYAESYKG